MSANAGTAATYIIFRLMAEVPTNESAESEVVRITPQIQRHATIQNHTVEQYWKIPAYQEITLTLKPNPSLITAYDGLVLLAESGWTHGGEQDGWSQCSVWNPVPKTELLSPSIKWAELSLWGPDAEDDGETSG
jgi:hypothetical protein